MPTHLGREDHDPHGLITDAPNIHVITWTTERSGASSRPNVLLTHLVPSPFRQAPQAGYPSPTRPTGPSTSTRPPASAESGDGQTGGPAVESAAEDMLK